MPLLVLVARQLGALQTDPTEIREFLVEHHPLSLEEYLNLPTLDLEPLAVDSVHLRLHVHLDELLSCNDKVAQKWQSGLAKVSADWTRHIDGPPPIYTASYVKNRAATMPPESRIESSACSSEEGKDADEQSEFEDESKGENFQFRKRRKVLRRQSSRDVK